MTQRPGTLAQDERIENIQTLQYLKKFACPKVQHKKDWYTECEKCPGQNSCKTGTRVMKLTGKAPKPKPKPQENPVIEKRREIGYSGGLQVRTRETIRQIFEQKDPVRYLLEHSESPKPMAVYQKVKSWKHKYPDLEKRYHMMEKVRFLWSDPYDRMSIPDILRALYTRESQESSIPEVMYAPEPETEDEISLDDFLAEMDR